MQLQPKRLTSWTFYFSLACLEGWTVDLWMNPMKKTTTDHCNLTAVPVMPYVHVYGEYSQHS